jgi:hypothetical protein
LQQKQQKKKKKKKKKRLSRGKFKRGFWWSPADVDDMKNMPRLQKISE